MSDVERHVAIVAIHGVADQQPGDSARAAADLLLRDSKAEYSSFEECGLRIPVERMPLSCRLEVTKRGMLDQRPELLRARAERRALPFEATAPRPVAATAEMAAVAATAYDEDLPPGTEPETEARPDTEAETATRIDAETDYRNFVERAATLPGVAPEAAAGLGKRDGGSAPPPGALEDEWESHEIMREQLQGYAPDAADAIYETIRLRARRKADAGGAGADHRVDVYEMYWADLSRLGNRLIGVVLSFYQLLFLLVRLGGLTLGRARARFGADGSGWRGVSWKAFGLAHGLAELLLVLGVPIVNLGLLALASALLVPLAGHYLPGWAPAIQAGWRPVVLVLVLAVVAFKTRQALKPRWVWACVFGLVLAVAAASGWLLRNEAPDRATLVAAYAAGGFCLLMVFGPTFKRPPGFLRSRSVWAPAGLVLAVFISWSARLGFGSVGLELFCWLLAVGAIFAILVPWNGRRSGALAVGALLLGLMTGLWLWVATPGAEPVAIAEAVAGRITGADGPGPGLLPSTWGLFFLLAAAATAAGLAATLRSPRRGRERKAAWTANLTLTLSGFVVLVVNLALWKALAIIGGKIPGLATYVTSIHRFVEHSTILNFWVILSLAALAVVFAVWLILPAGLSELQRDNPDREASTWLGEALEIAFKLLRGPGETIRWLLVLGLPVALIVAGKYFAAQGASSRDIAMVVALGGLAVVMMTGKGPLRFLGLGFRAVLDILLDVANWLRLDPATRTPRARICARYLALLRHLAEWRDPVDGKGYERIVILAHSQGTVITADLFRFLRWENLLLELIGKADPAVERLFGSPRPEARDLPVHLFTMGCPLRQLYSRRFPFYYGWAECPDPATLGVETWLNTYRSGDYVGRELWTSGNNRWDPWQPPQPVVPPGRTGEYCIGAGGHTHYWDGSARPVGPALDHLATR